MSPSVCPWMWLFLGSSFLGGSSALNSMPNGRHRSARTHGSSGHVHEMGLQENCWRRTHFIPPVLKMGHFIVIQVGSFLFASSWGTAACSLFCQVLTNIIHSESALESPPPEGKLMWGVLIPSTTLPWTACSRAVIMKANLRSPMRCMLLSMYMLCKTLKKNPKTLHIICFPNCKKSILDMFKMKNSGCFSAKEVLSFPSVT